MTTGTLKPSRATRKPTRNRIGPIRWLTGKGRVLPDFIIIGAMKGGTTALFKYLEGHPDVVLPITKEIHFFDNQYHRGLTWYRAHFPSELYRACSSALRGRRWITGEATPSYLVHPNAARRIREALPQVKLIALLRNPAERAYSHFQHNARKGRETDSMEEALRKEEERLRSGIDGILEDEEYYFEHRQFSYLLRGIYVDQIRRWLEAFPAEQLLILKTEDLDEDRSGTFRRVIEFLGLSAWEPEDFKTHHHYGYPKIEDALRRRLIEFFRPHNRRLYDLLGRDFGWDA